MSAETATGPGVTPSYRYVEAWGMAAGSYARVHRPRTVEEIQAVLASARDRGVSVALRGTGNSYGDASTNADGEVLEIHRMNRVLAFDADTGVQTIGVQ